MSKQQLSFEDSMINSVTKLIRRDTRDIEGYRFFKLRPRPTVDYNYWGRFSIAEKIPYIMLRKSEDDSLFSRRNSLCFRADSNYGFGRLAKGDPNQKLISKKVYTYFRVFKRAKSNNLTLSVKDSARDSYFSRHKNYKIEKEFLSKEEFLEDMRIHFKTLPRKRVLKLLSI